MPGRPLAPAADPAPLRRDPARDRRRPRSYLTALVSRPDPRGPARALPHLAGGPHEHQPGRAPRGVSARSTTGSSGAATRCPSPPGRAAISTPRSRPIPGRRRRSRIADGRGFDTRVAEVDAVYGNVAPGGAGRRLRVRRHRADDLLRAQAGRARYRTLYGRTYTDVKKGEWVAFPDADGRTVLARTLADAAGSAGLRVGDPRLALGYWSPHRPAATLTAGSGRRPTSSRRPRPPGCRAGRPRRRGSVRGGTPMSLAARRNMSGAGLPCSTSSAVTTTGKRGARPVFSSVFATTSLVPPEARATGLRPADPPRELDHGADELQLLRASPCRWPPCPCRPSPGPASRPWCRPRSAATFREGTPPSA